MMISGRCGLDIVQRNVAETHNNDLLVRLSAKTKKRHRATARILCVAEDDQPGFVTRPHRVSRPAGASSSLSVSSSRGGFRGKKQRHR
jgi:hypothetical protein